MTISFRKNAAKVLSGLLRNDLQYVGGKEYFSKPGTSFHVLDWDDNICYGEELYNQAREFQNWIKKQIIGVDQSFINYSSAWALYQKLIIDFKNRKRVLIETLVSKPFVEHYEEQDAEFAVDFIANEITRGYRTYTVYTRINYLQFEDGITQIRIGKNTFRKINPEESNTIKKTLPEKGLTFGDLIKPGMLVGKEKLTQEQFLKFSENKLFAVRTIKGLQIHDEKSEVYSQIVDDLIVSTSFFLLKNEIGSVSKPGIRYSAYQLSDREPADTMLLDSEGNLTLIENPIESGRLSNRVFYIGMESESYLNEFGNLSELNGIVEDEAGGEIRNKILTGLHWFHKGQVTLDETETILFYFISLESLFSTNNDPTISLSDQMAENAALMLASAPETRLKYKEKLRAAYRLRSAIVHQGVKAKIHSEYDEMLNIAFANSICILKFFRNYTKIKSFGTNVKALKKFFDSIKMQGPAL